MYTFASQMKSLPIISLQTGGTVAWTKGLILDMGSFEIRAYRCDQEGSSSKLILLARDIRQLAADCVIIDSEDELTEAQDIVRLKDMVEESYDPLDKPVVSDAGRKLGNVEDYTINLETQRVQKLHVRQSIIKSWLGNNLIIDRTQIIDITPKQIIVRDATVKAPIMQTEPVPDSPSL